MTTWWRYAYDVVVILLSVLGAVVALTLLRPGHARLRRGFTALAWIAAGLLTLRGVAGLVVDGTADPIWWPTFLAGGLLFGGVARLSRPHDAPSTTPTQLAH
jgi:lipopolysaccharide export LptBFGC system permease protein LptF